MQRIIICADMDAFFASVEQQANPRLRGRPIAVIGSGHRTVITTRSYEARKYGVKTGMNVYEAKKLCPGIIFVIGDNEKYTYTCSLLENIYRHFTPDVEIYSIDEAFLDITTTHHFFKGPEAIGISIKEAIRTQFGINCTVGIAPNILLAKLASDLAKPDGLMRITEERAQTLLEALPVRELWGIGSKTEARLALLGVRTCGELGRAPASLLRSKFGILGETLRAMGQGVCSRPVAATEEEPKSIGHSMTLPRDICNPAEIEAQLLKLSEMVGRRARKYAYRGETISLTIRYRDFETFSKQTKIRSCTNDTHVIYQQALGILSGIRLKDRVRLLGVCLSGLVKDHGQVLLMDDERRRESILCAMDAVNEKHGDCKLVWGAYIMQKKGAGVISPSWRPSGVKHVVVK